MKVVRRAEDSGVTTWQLRDPVWVSCPRCAGPARSDRDDTNESFRVVCRSCAYSAEAPQKSVHQWVGEDTDGRFGLPLYLAVDFGGHRLWAYNLEHLDLLAEWLGADLRERQKHGESQNRNRTMMSRLPSWLKAASARPRVLKALAELRQRAIREGLE